ncbi:hypothetical protein EDF27_0484 [Curtobacterium sp. PhB136]|nr:hypothetical protein EDF27_0484 [Curtobacterium sp. PhB136]
MEKEVVETLYLHPTKSEFVKDRDAVDADRLELDATRSVAHGTNLRYVSQLQEALPDGVEKRAGYIRPKHAFVEIIRIDTDLAQQH